MKALVLGNALKDQLTWSKFSQRNLLIKEFKIFHFFSHRKLQVRRDGFHENAFIYGGAWKINLCDPSSLRLIFIDKFSS